MNARFLLIVASLIFAVFTIIIGFGWWDDQVRHIFGWYGLSFACLVASFLPIPVVNRS
jgi:hypothetical protein